MDVSNKSIYQSSIYSAIVVNENINDDPQSKYRIQIYIPSMYPEYLDIYEDYMKSSDKSSNGNKDKFPWAQTLVKDLKVGNIVYGSFLYGKANQFIILGLDATNPKNQESNTNSAYDITGSGIVDLAMGIIMHNEVGLAIGQYPDGLTDSNYGNINPADNGGCSIGLLQWHESNAIDLLKSIKEADSNWESYWSDKSLTTYLSLKSGNISYSNFGGSWKLTKGSSEYNAIHSMLVSEPGKTVQKQKACERTANSIQLLTDKYQVTNPAIIIYCADIMNQYGNGVNNASKYPNLKGCLDQAKSCSSESDVMTGLDKFVSWWKDKTKNYYSRRDTTYSYIKSCYDQGKLTTGGLTDQGEAGNVISGNGQYCHPFKGSSVITATWGKGGYRRSGGYHTGIDFSMPQGTPLYACTNGTTASCSPSYGLGMVLTADDGNKIYYGHCSKHVKTGRVNKGDLIAYSGNTGHSSGPHLHFEIRKSPYKYAENGTGSDVNPLPYIGVQGNSEYYDKTITF